MVQTICLMDCTSSGDVSTYLVCSETPSKLGVRLISVQDSILRGGHIEISIGSSIRFSIEISIGSLNRSSFVH